MKRKWSYFLKYFLAWFVMAVILFVLQAVISLVLEKPGSPAAQETEYAAETEEETAEPLVLTIPRQEDIEVISQYTAHRDYTVKQGDTLWDIAERYRGNPLEYQFLAEWNMIEDPNLIYPGQFLVIPVEVQEIALQKNDWFFQHDIPVMPQGDFSIPLTAQDPNVGKGADVLELPVTVKIRAFDEDFKKSGYRLIEAVFEFRTENLPAGVDSISWYYEVADRYTGVSFVQRSTKLTEASVGGTEAEEYQPIEESTDSSVDASPRFSGNQIEAKVYELAIKDADGEYEGIIDVVYSFTSSQITIQAEVPKGYDGLVFGLGEYVDIDEGSYDPDVLYTLDQFGIEGTKQFYFSESGY